MVKASGFWGGLAALVFISTATQAAVINYPDFSDTSGLTLNGDAHQVGNVLRLTGNTTGQAGSAFSTNLVNLDLNASFSTKFVFNISAPGGICDVDGCGADGIVFVVQTVANNVGGAGGGIGYLGINNSLGVEFDTWDNGSSLGDLDGNHVAVDIGGTFTSSPYATVANRMNDGQNHYVWIDYNGATDLLEVRLSLADSRPVAALLSGAFDLPTILGATDAFVGFTSGTGAAYGNHDILSWEFRSTFDPIDEPNGVPEPWSVLLFGAGLAGLGLARRRH